MFIRQALAIAALVSVPGCTSASHSSLELQPSALRCEHEDIDNAHAAVVLGFIDPDHFLGGRMPLDRAAAERALAPIAERPGDIPR